MKEGKVVFLAGGDGTSVFLDRYSHSPALLKLKRR